MKDPIEITINCHECSPHQFEDALNNLDAVFKCYNTDDLDCVIWPDYNEWGDATIELHNIPDDKMDWAYEKIDEAMQDIPAWSID